MSNRPTVQNRPNHGGNLAWAAAFADCPPSSILDFSASINPLGPPESAIAAIQSHLLDITAYPSPDYRRLREALAEFHDVQPEWVLPGNGAADLLTWIGRDLAATSATVWMTPGFGDYFRALSAFKGFMIDHALDVEKLFERVGLNQLFEPSAAIDAVSLASMVSAIQERLGRDCSDIGLLINNPHNPTGILWSADAIANCCKQFKWVVVDEAFMDFLPSDAQQSLIDRVGDHPNLVVVRSLTKFYSLPGLRIGYAVAHPEHVQRWQQWRDPWPVNALAEVAAIAALGDRQFQDQTIEWLKKARRHLFRGLGDLEPLQPYPGSANFLLVRSQVSVPLLQARILKRHRILIRDCLSFDGLGDRYFRVAVRTQDDNQALIQALNDCL